MKELFVAYARYNQKANAAIFAAVKTMGPSGLIATIKAYYPTIADTLFHTLKSDIKWLDRLSSFRRSSIPADAAGAFMQGEKLDLELLTAKAGAFVELRAKVDEEIQATIAAIPEIAFAASFEISLGPNRVNRPLWQLLLQWHNHQTHHRGQASVQLDALGIDNDFSGMLDKID